MHDINVKNEDNSDIDQNALAKLLIWGRISTRDAPCQQSIGKFDHCDWCTLRREG